jgi:hypothetical protein
MIELELTARYRDIDILRHVIVISLSTTVLRTEDEPSNDHMRLSNRLAQRGPLMTSSSKSLPAG